MVHHSFYGSILFRYCFISKCCKNEIETVCIVTPRTFTVYALLIVYKHIFCANCSLRFKLLVYKIVLWGLDYLFIKSIRRLGVVELSPLPFPVISFLSTKMPFLSECDLPLTGDISKMPVEKFTSPPHNDMVGLWRTEHHQVAYDGPLDPIR